MEKNYTITGRREAALGTTEVTLAPQTPEDRLAFVPGQYIELWLKEPPYSDDGGTHREFSINSRPDDADLRITFRNSESAAKRGFLDAPIGSGMVVSGPHGYFTLPEDTHEPAVLIAGGVGVTPFLSMVRAGVGTPEYHRIALIAANSGPDRAPHRIELEGIAKKESWFSYHPVYGKLTPEAIQEASRDIENPAYYVAGPPGMVKATFDMLTALGIPRKDIQLEEFDGYK